jgi:hypothetical protein
VTIPTNRLRAKQLSLEWNILRDGRAALVFDKPTWLAYEETAATRGQTAQQMISASVVSAIGPILVDHYSHPEANEPVTNRRAAPDKVSWARVSRATRLRRSTGKGAGGPRCIPRCRRGGTPAFAGAG